MPELIAPTTRLHASWKEARDEWPPGAHMDGHSVRATDDVDSAEGFAEWVARLRDEADPSTPLDEGLVHCTYRWIVEDDEYLGAVALRHTLNDFLLNVGGHIGYGVRPSARRQGLAGWALGRTLETARTLGLDRVLVTCVPSNVASARTIEKNGGVYEDTRTTGPDTVKRYWIALGPA
ncbi:GNAT family N-acetyltransferase [Paractinoplanes hotanensis]|uniref:GNAT family N-acetyltransferase n=1 Tax=Paractinoplanes hotanensis TaxID=2906497 RepID=A0ABT0XW41_9ACTN|nr:GNAT family N-acetyltransferase [Actinoplanes hotanensis]MCM4077825.1 GNAT family N-acetyltransferase [Actinoplanes hotanensis]